MSMDRRGFLGRLLAGLSVASVAPALDLTAFASPVAAPVPLTATYTDWLERVAHDGLALFTDALPFDTYHLTSASQLGDGPLREQFCIMLDPVHQDADDYERFKEQQLAPAMYQLAESARSASAFGRLPNPFGVSSATVTNAAGVSLRAVTMRYESLLRFDVVCG